MQQVIWSDQRDDPGNDIVFLQGENAGRHRNTLTRANAQILVSISIVTTLSIFLLPTGRPSST